jgi:hypothetical protein
MESIKQALQYGPIAGAVFASDENWRFHHGPGIIEGCADDQGVNLYVTFVGYDKDEYGRDFLIGKNNWGSHWGWFGYFNIYPDSCGILDSNFLY